MSVLIVEFSVYRCMFVDKSKMLCLSFSVRGGPLDSSIIVFELIDSTPLLLLPPVDAVCRDVENCERNCKTKWSLKKLYHERIYSEMSGLSSMKFSRFLQH